MYDSIRPGQVWLDTEGKRIQAHGGSIIFIDGTYYFYGENKEKTDGSSTLLHWGVRAYRSKDLYNWEDCGLIIPPEPDNPGSSLHPHSMMDRPHIIFGASSPCTGEPSIAVLILMFVLKLTALLAQGSPLSPSVFQCLCLN